MLGWIFAAAAPFIGVGLMRSCDWAPDYFRRMQWTAAGLLLAGIAAGIVLLAGWAKRVRSSGQRVGQWLTGAGLLLWLLIGTFVIGLSRPVCVPEASYTMRLNNHDCTFYVHHYGGWFVNCYDVWLQKDHAATVTRLGEGLCRCRIEGEPSVTGSKVYFYFSDNHLFHRSNKMLEYDAVSGSAQWMLSNR